jgi:hypothetical protein
MKRNGGKFYKAWVWGQRMMRQKMVTFGMLDCSLLRPVLACHTFWNLRTVYFFNFQIFIRAAANHGYWIGGYGGTTVFIISSLSLLFSSHTIVLEKTVSYKLEIPCHIVDNWSQTGQAARHHCSVMLQYQLYGIFFQLSKECFTWVFHKWDNQLQCPSNAADDLVISLCL